jgi:hypothetical protein
MKNDTTTTLLNFVLAILVILGVVFALTTISRTRDLRQLQTRAQILQINSLRLQALANDAAIYNNTAKSVELDQILKGAATPAAQPAAK